MADGLADMYYGHLPDDRVPAGLAVEVIIDGPLRILNQDGRNQFVAREAISNSSNLFIIEVPNRDHQCFRQVDGILVRFFLKLTVKFASMMPVYYQKQHPFHEEYQQHQTDSQLCGDGSMFIQTDTTDAGCL